MNAGFIIAGSIVAYLGIGVLWVRLRLPSWWRQEQGLAVRSRSPEDWDVRSPVEEDVALRVIAGILFWPIVFLVWYPLIVTGAGVIWGTSKLLDSTNPRLEEQRRREEAERVERARIARDREIERLEREKAEWEQQQQDYALREIERERQRHQEEDNP